MKRILFTIFFACLVMISSAQDDPRSSSKSSTRPKQSGNTEQNNPRISTGTRTNTSQQDSSKTVNTTRTGKPIGKVKGKPREQSK